MEKKNETKAQKWFMEEFADILIFCLVNLPQLLTSE